MFQTVILAGGEGTRLRPLTCDLPKTHGPVVRLPSHGLYFGSAAGAPRRKEVFVTLGYRPQSHHQVLHRPAPNRDGPSLCGGGSLPKVRRGA